MSHERNAGRATLRIAPQDTWILDAGFATINRPRLTVLPAWDSACNILQSVPASTEGAKEHSWNIRCTRSLQDLAQSATSYP
jgi:hypothetical protein